MPVNPKLNDKTRWAQSTVPLAHELRANLNLIAESSKKTGEIRRLCEEHRTVYSCDSLRVHPISKNLPLITSLLPALPLQQKEERKAQELRVGGGEGGHEAGQAPRDQKIRR